VWSALAFANGSLRCDIEPLLERVRVPTSILWGARESQVGVATGRRLAALRLDLPLMRIDNTEACSELERHAAVRIVIRAKIRGLSKCADPAAH
jgi:hypothetical protein